MISPGGGYRALREATRETILRIHDHAASIGETWDFGVRDVGSVDNFLSHLQRMATADDPPATIAAWAMHYIVAEHPFWDGNHRTGLLMAQLILGAFGQKITGTPEEIERHVRAIDRESLAIAAVEDWIRSTLGPAALP